MDWVIAGSIAAAIGSAFKVVADKWKGKEVPLWEWLISFVIFCLILYFGIYTRLDQKTNDQSRTDQFLSGISDGTKHTDTSISKTKDELQDSANAREKRLEGTIRGYKKERLEDKKPNVDILPINNVLNPRMERVGSTDSFKMYVILKNYGATYAKNIAINITCVTSLNDSFKVDPIDFTNKLNKVEHLAPGDDLLQETFNTRYRWLTPDLTLIRCITLCYKDSLNRKYGPFAHIFKIRLGDIHAPMEILDDKEYDKVEALLKKYKLWKSDYF